MTQLIRELSVGDQFKISPNDPEFGQDPDFDWHGVYTVAEAPSLATSPLMTVVSAVCSLGAEVVHANDSSGELCGFSPDSEVIPN